MKPKRKEFREPETLHGWYDDIDMTALVEIDSSRKFKSGDVRIIRERDYQLLLRAVKGKGK